MPRSYVALDGDSSGSIVSNTVDMLCALDTLYTGDRCGSGFLSIEVC